MAVGGSVDDSKIAGAAVLAVGVGGQTKDVTEGTGVARRARAPAAMVGGEITATKMHSARTQNATKITMTRSMVLWGEGRLAGFTGPQYSTGPLTGG